jgi:putative peptide zinc metalloprotease protein
MAATYSEHWYRVAHLHPLLRSHVKLDRHSYRGDIWHVLKDPISGRQHRLNRLAYRIVARFDGRLSMQEIWDLTIAEAGDEAPTQPEALALLAQLHEAELIQTESAHDVAGLFDATDKRRGRERRQRLNPLSLRVGLFDPTPVLDAIAPIAALFLRRWAAWAWLALVVVALAMLAPQAGVLHAYASQHLSTPRVLLVLWLAYPVVKTVHEFAHALAVRVWGGAVPEMGISVLMLMPVPYVDASSAAGFRERHRRVVVSLMGILAETTLAALAALLWLHMADGIAREIAFGVMVIGGVSTVLFNGNPLMRYDAYHALADAIESPGLGGRSDAYWRYLARRYVLGVSAAVPPAVARGERRWLLGYGLASGVYRLVAAVLVVGWLVGVHLFIGALAALWFVFSVLGRPAWRLLDYVRHAPELGGRRARAGAFTAVALGAPLLVVFALPWPDATRAEGVVLAPEQSQLRAGAEGFVERVLVQDGQLVAAGEVVVQLRDPDLATELERVQARLRGLDVAYHNAVFRQPAQANAVEQDILRASAERERVEARIAALAVRSDVAGRVALSQAQDLAGVYIARGALVGHVLANDRVSLRVVVSQADVARLQQTPGRIEVRLADGGIDSRGNARARAVAEPQTTAAVANLRAQTPAALQKLPSAALGDRAGGAIVTDPADPEGLRTLEPMFSFDLWLPHRSLERIGARASVRFDHGSSPLALQWYRSLQQLFIGQFSA